MALLVLVPAAPEPVDSTRGIFISYSHRDWRLAQEFFKVLRLMIEGESDLKLAEDRVFFDREGLKAGEYWDERLQQALESSRVFIFLVSVESTTSEYCRDKELQVAVARGMRILPVMLEEVPSWSTLRAGTDPSGKSRLLGQIGALPKDKAFTLRSINKWGRRSEAWSAVTSGIAATLRGDGEAMYTELPGATPLPSASTSPFLPYLCDRNDPITRYTGKIQLRAQRAILLIVKGIPEDASSKFWERLWLEYLCADARNQGVPCLPTRPLPDLPSPEFVLEERSAAQSVVLVSLLKAVLGYTPAEPSVAELEAALRNSGGLVPAFATLRPGSTEAQSAIVAALANCIEQCTLEAAGRLALCLTIEQPDLFVRRLDKDWQLDELKKTFVLELGPLGPVEPYDVRQWHQERQIEQRFGVSELRLVKAVGKQPLRMLLFRERVAPLLGLNRKK